MYGVQIAPRPVSASDATVSYVSECFLSLHIILMLLNQASIGTFDLSGKVLLATQSGAHEYCSAVPL